MLEAPCFHLNQLLLRLTIVYVSMEALSKAFFLKSRLANRNRGKVAPLGMFRKAHESELLLMCDRLTRDRSFSTEMTRSQSQFRPLHRLSYLPNSSLIYMPCPARLIL
jgi:hypothetical protein